MRKTLFLFLIIAAMVFISVSCDNKEEKKESQVKTNVTQTKTDTSKKYKIALVMKTLTNPFFISMEKGARKAEKEFNLNLLVKTAANETSIEQQIAIVEEMIEQKVDALIIAPTNSIELVPVLKKVQDKGIPIINIDDKLDPDYMKKYKMKDIPFVSVDNENGAYIAAKYLIEGVNKPVKAAIIEGIPEASNSYKRKNGALKAFKENPNIQLTEIRSGHWKIDEGHDVAKALLTKYPDIKIIFCCNDMMALGAVQYIKESGIKGISVGGYDNIDEAAKEVKAGNLKVTLDQRPFDQGYAGAKFAYQLLKKEKVPLVTYIDVALVTADTLKK